MSYPIPAAEIHTEIEIKKSRFIAYANHIHSREEGMVWLETLKKKYPDARHHCWAYLLGNPSCATNAGMGDDGEPSGTAGKPILNVLHHKGIGDVMIVVVRYFGGIKLGAGGLTRAYGQAAQAVILDLPVQTRIAMQVFEVMCDFSLEQQVRHFTLQAQGEVVAVGYAEQVQMNLNVPQAQSDSFCQHLNALGCEYKMLEAE